MADVFNMDGDKLKLKERYQINVDNKDINLQIDSSYWCLYEGDCFTHLLDDMTQLFVCLYCEYRDDLDIPAIIQDQNPILEGKEE